MSINAFMSFISYMPLSLICLYLLYAFISLCLYALSLYLCLKDICIYIYRHITYILNGHKPIRAKYLKNTRFTPKLIEPH